MSVGLCFDKKGQVLRHDSRVQSWLRSELSWQHHQCQVLRPYSAIIAEGAGHPTQLALRLLRLTMW